MIELEKRIEQLEKAIRDANDSLLAEEGIDLLQSMKFPMGAKGDAASIDVIEGILEEPPEKRAPHKHADVIKAWADGEAIQCRGAGDVRWAHWPRDSIPPVYDDTIEWRVYPRRA